MNTLSYVQKKSERAFYVIFRNIHSAGDKDESLNFMITMFWEFTNDKQYKENSASNL